MTLAQALAELPDSPDAIAALLLEQGIVGARHSANTCPLANYLRRKLRCAGGYVRVNNDRIALINEDGWPDAATGIAGSLVSFIRAFDTGLYDDLIDPQA